MSLRYRFGRFELCPESRQLFERGVCATLGGRAFDLLLALVERAGRTVSRDELYELVWPGVAVEPNNLHVQIWALRGLLGRDAIATVARRGYRFTAEVECVDTQNRPGVPATRIDVLANSADTDPVGDDSIEMLAARVRRHRLVTLVGDDDTSLVAAADSVVRAMRPMLERGVWHLDPLTLARTWPGHACAASPAHANAALPGGLDRLLERLAMREALLVIHGCHRCADHARAAVVATLLRAPAVRVLASSRAPLAVDGESVVRIARRFL